MPSSVRWMREKPIIHAKTGEKIWCVDIPAQVADDLEFPVIKKTGKVKKHYRWTTHIDAEHFARDTLEKHKTFLAEGVVTTGVYTVEDVVNYYKTNSLFIQHTARNTQRTYNSMFRRMENVYLTSASKRFYSRMAKGLVGQDIEDLYQYNIENVSLHHANMTHKALRRAFNVAKLLKRVTDNPFNGFKLLATDNRTVEWEPEQVELFIKTADELGYWSMGTLALMAHDLCQRIGDCRQMTWGQYDGEYFSVLQEKTKRHNPHNETLDIKHTNRLRDRLADAHRKNNNWKKNIILYEKTGKPYDNRMYNKLRCEIFNAAGLPNSIWMSDLRRTGLSHLGRVGASIIQLQSMSGHKDPRMLNIYVRKGRDNTSKAQELSGL